jgi:predicted esterase
MSKHIIAVILLEIALLGQWGRGQSTQPATQPINLSGLWLTNAGLMELEQTGDKVKGRYALMGTSDIKGTVTGSKFDFTFKSFRRGKGAFDIASDGKTLSGTAKATGAKNADKWTGRRAPEFVRHAKLIPATMIDGSTDTLLSYAIHAPEAYRESDNKKWPTIVILHGSNMNSRAYVNTIAAAWPDIAKEFIILGINGEQPSSLGGKKDEEPAFNYTYVDFVGKSTFKGFPGTDRESPALVCESLAELRKVYPIDRYFVGGHSQGGFLTYSLLMNYPEQFAGAFPISAGVIFQCEPSAFTGEKIKVAQRAVPLVIVHGKQDPNVNFSAGQHAATLFGESNWPAFRFIADNSGAGHRFGLLPIDKAIRWLEALSSDDPNRLLDFAEQSFKEKHYRDAFAALKRARERTPADASHDRLDQVTKKLDAAAQPGAAKFLAKIRENKDKTWIDGFLTYRDDFEFAPAAGEVMQTFNTLRAEHEDPAKQALDGARTAFQNGQRDAGYAKYQEIADKWYASSSYRNVKRWLAERK